MKKTDDQAEVRNAKTAYFFVTILIYLGIFVLEYLLASLVFTVFSIHPYLRLAIVAVLMAVDVKLTGFLMNGKMLNRWLR